MPKLKASSEIKVALSIRLSPEVVAYFKADGPGYQGRIDEALREWIASRPASSDKRPRKQA